MKSEFSTAYSSDSDGGNDYKNKGGITTLSPQCHIVFLSENNQAVFIWRGEDVEKESLDPKKIS